MIHFAFAKASDTTAEGYFISKQGYWRTDHLPENFRISIRKIDVKELQAVSIGPGNKYFLRTNDKHHSHGIPAGTPLDSIRWCSFGPRNRIAIRKNNGAMYKQNDIISLRDKLDKLDDTSHITHLCYGSGDSWIFCHKGIWHWYGIPERLATKLKEAKSKQTPVKNVVLSHFNHNLWFLEYANGSSAYCLPASWHHNVDFVRNHK
ncbi:hypothetical protein CONPUDRAFT_151407 [Coniophora puteana RWD-64-598 SS2]|uniref:Uncharacterized protein n=1 Tax=Coniophora puteana (strain RWD-64-598) TaxID=741705 RepID=A0A5M3MZG6_CONPW|nr:uncharacterized protein CONPUDRAFT_151407 [Coniophora puteana RWD-64-598 SS2]EIW84387.1 hypothetical protein CONPUDRAFT_151407 [Coniophora puteana RWD-64-598 SS2]